MNKTELATAYGVSRITMRNYLVNNVPGLKVKKWQQRFTTRQVLHILKHLGPFVNENWDGRHNSITQ